MRSANLPESITGSSEKLCVLFTDLMRVRHITTAPFPAVQRRNIPQWT